MTIANSRLENGSLWESGEDEEFVTELTEPVIDYQYVLGMDPGGTTGVAMLRYSEHTAPELIYLAQIPDGRVGFFEFFQGSVMGEETGVTPVSEQWVNRNVKGANLEPAYIEGVQYALWQDAVVYQTPDMKSLVPDEWLKENNLWTPGKRHQMDALIHALVYLRNEAHEPTVEALSGEADEPMAQEGEAEGASEQGEAIQEAAEQARAAAQAAQEAMEALAEAMREMSEQNAEAMAQAVEIDTSQEQGEPTAGSHEHGPVEVIDDSDPEVKGERKRIERNGVFAGYASDMDGSTMFDGKL